MNIAYENKDGINKSETSLCYGKCIEGLIARLTCFYEGEDININKKIYFKQLNGYVANNKCKFENFLK